MTFTIRPFNPTDAEYEAVVAVYNAVWPDKPNTAEAIKYRDQIQNPQFLRQHFVAENEQGHIIAEATCSENSESYVAGKYNLGMSIHPDYDHQTVAQQLYDYLIQFLGTRSPKPTIFETYVSEDHTSQIQFFAAQGYQQVQRDPTSEIDLIKTSHDHLVGVLERLTTTGIEICTLTEMSERDAKWQQHCYQIAMAIEADIPSPDPFTPEPFEEFIKIFDHPPFLPDGTFFAIDQKKWVGMSNLWRDLARADRLKVGLTGVLPSHRRQGIATALKLRSFQYARQHNIRYIHTENEENNPMYDLNLKLGFKPKPALLTLRKNLEENPNVYHSTI